MKGVSCPRCVVHEYTSTLFEDGSNLAFPASQEKLMEVQGQTVRLLVDSNAVVHLLHGPGTKAGSAWRAIGEV